MEMTRRHPAAIQDPDADTAADGPQAELPRLIRDEGLTQWKRARLAHHHAYFARLDKAFRRWQQVTLARRQRRQRVIAACRVGATFFQRLYWDQWRVAMAHRRAAREAAIRKLWTVSRQIRLRTAWANWNDATNARTSRRIEPTKVPLADRMAVDRRLEVRGVRLQKPTTQGWTCEAVDDASATDQRLRVAQRIASLKRITVYYTQRHYFQLWRDAARTVEKIMTRELRDKADAFHMRSAWRRWRRGVAVHSEYHTAARQAVFLLYYHLTKASMARLRQFAIRQRQERGVSVVIASRVRRRRLRSAFAKWGQRLNAKLVFSQWRDVVTDVSSRQHSNPQLQVVRDIVRGLNNDRLLHRCFSAWLQQLAVRQRSRALTRVLHGPVSKVALAPAFQLWHRQTAIQRRLQDRGEARDLAHVARVWHAWTQFTKEKELRQKQRRTATRFWYFRTLGRAFTALQALARRRCAIEAAVETKKKEMLMRHTQEAFERWVAWCTRRHRRRDAAALAQHFHEEAMRRRVFQVLRANHLESRQREVIATNHLLQIDRKKIQAALDCWKAYHSQQQLHQQELQQRVSSHVHSRALRMMAIIFHTLDDYAKTKQSRRLVNAHARGHFQSRLLQRTLSSWVSSVAQLKWDHLFNQRAHLFRRQKLSRKCLGTWKKNARAARLFREKTRKALHHWKRVRERAAFEGWKRYVAEKRLQRERLHAALEFRHQAHLRDGLSHWIAGATHLAQQRGRRTMEMQATHTERVWRKVRDVARHWRYITHRSKSRTTERLERHAVIRREGVPRDFMSERVHVELQRVDRVLPVTHVATSRHPHPDAERLSDFVMLPRNRPRPRKPIELILDTHVIPDVGGNENVEAIDLVQAMSAVNRQYGFQFPLHPATIGSRNDTEAPLPQDEGYPTTRGHSARLDAAIDRSSGREVTVDELEKRLLHWQTRHQRLKHLQQSLEDFRLLLYQASMEGSLHPHELDHMQTRLRVMEEQEAASRRRWNESRPEILSLAQRIKSLRGVTAASA